MHSRCCKIPGFGRLIALKVLQIPAFGGVIALKCCKIPGFQFLNPHFQRNPCLPLSWGLPFWALTTGSIFSNQTLGGALKVLQIPGFGGFLALKVLQIPGFGGLLALKVLQIPGFGGLLALKVLQIPGFGGLLALKMLQIPGFGWSHCTESAASSKTWWPDAVNFQGLGA